MRDDIHLLHRRRKIVRGAVGLVLLGQLALVGAFLAGWIREPYPALILPGFDQVLVDADGHHGFTFARLHVRLNGGRREEVHLRDLLPEVPGARAYWVLSRLAAPPVQGRWQPTLPSRGYQLQDPTPSRAFLDLLATRAAESATSGTPEALEITWERRRFDTSGGRAVELESQPIATITVPIESPYAAGR